MYVHANIGKTNKRESVRTAGLLELWSSSLSCVCLCVFGEGMRGGAMLKLWKPRCVRVFVCVWEDPLLCSVALWDRCVFTLESSLIARYEWAEEVRDYLRGQRWRIPSKPTNPAWRPRMKIKRVVL